MWKTIGSTVIIMFFMVPAFAETMVIRHIRPSAKDNRLAYRLEVLTLALNKAKVSYQLVPVESPMPISRAFIETNQANPTLDIISSQTSLEREKLLRPIRFPIDRGVMGCRVFLVRQQDQNLFQDVKNLEDLKKFSFGFMKSWLDTELFQAVGLKVVFASKYENLFEMVAAGRFSAFSRSVAEVSMEKKTFSTPQRPLVIEENLMLQYPAAEYFFVRQTDEKLYNAVYSGLATAFKDGSFLKLFDRYYADEFSALKMKKRRVIKIPNPLLPPQVMEVDPKWWYYK